MIKFRNNSYSTLAGGISDVATSFSCQAGHGDRFPVIAAPDIAYITFEDSGGNREVVKVTARGSGSDTFTIVRAQDNTAARAWLAGDVVEQRIVALELDRFESLQNIDASNSKATPVDADLIGLIDSAASNALKKLTWANLKATAKTYFDTLYAKVGAVTAGGITMSTARLLGRSTASTGAVEEITVGTGLSLSAGSLAVDTELAALAGLTSAANKVPYFTGSGTAGVLDFLDEDAFTSNSATAVPSQQSVKAYVDAGLAAAGVYRQIVSVDISAASAATIIPPDTSTPLVSEGTQVATLTINLADNTNKVEVAAAFTSWGSGADTMTAALFRGSTCIAVVTNYQQFNGGTLVFNLVDAPATAGNVTYSIRVGGNTGGGWYTNYPSFGGASDENQLILKEIVV